MGATSEYSLSATIFIVSDIIGKDKKYFNWNQAREMTRRGICFQSHTCSHPDLTKVNNDTLQKELVQSKSKIESELGSEVNHFAYPYGSFNLKVMGFVKHSGYHGKSILFQLLLLF